VAGSGVEATPPGALHFSGPSTPPSSASTKRTPFRASIGSIPSCPPPRRIERDGFYYRRHGTLSLCAALETASGRVHGKTAARHSSQDFVGFLEEVVASAR